MIYKKFEEQLRDIDKDFARKPEVEGQSKTARSLKRRTAVSVVLSDFEAALAEEYLTVDLSRNQRNVLFDRAWGEGHAYGVHEVEHHYGELAEFISVFVEA